ncbi:transposase [Novosphingobium sp. AAP1]|uniref:IS66-like element accessory protein TnpA n=1 Tax=Novosphingobium sp. AAP1 TaxID=1523413 RepID=UPI001E2EC417|nr:transposase [Novosphingobium sp. AAP1]
MERRRRYSDEERAAVLAMCDEPKATIVGVAKRLGMSPGLIHGWRRMRREAEKLSSEPLQFIAYGSVGEPSGQVPAPTPITPPPAPVPHTAAEELTCPHPGTRPGAIDVDLPNGIRLSVDSYVNEKALARVLRALRDVA